MNIDTKHTTIENWDDFFKTLSSNYSQNNPSFDKPLRINYYEFKSKVKIENKIDFYLIFSNCIFEDTLIFNNVIFNLRLHINNCTFKNYLTIGGETTAYNSTLRIMACTGDITIHQGEFKFCEIYMMAGSKINIFGGNFQNLTIKGVFPTQLDYLKINSMNVTGNVNISGPNLTLDKLYIREHSSELKITILNVMIRFIEINNFRTETGLKLINLTPSGNSSTFNLIDSILGKSEFQNFNFSLFHNIEIKNTNLSDCSFVNTTLSFKINSNEPELKFYRTSIKKYLFNLLIYPLVIDSKKFELYSGRRDIYNQIKHVLNKSGDTVLEQEAHVYEMLSLNKTLSWRHHWITKLILYLSYITSNFGQSLSRPFAFLIIVHFILILLFLLTGNIENTEFTFNPFENLKSNKVVISKYFASISPIRKFEDYKSYGIDGIILDLLMRVSGSFMLYNMIRASRRYIN